MKRTVATGLMTSLGALATAAVTDSATARTDSYNSRYGDDYSISCSSDYYWRRWQLQRPNRLLQRWLLLQRRLGRLIETRHEGVVYSDAAVDDDYCAATADMAWHALARKPVKPE